MHRGYAAAMIGPIASATVAAVDIDEVTAAYCTCFDFHVLGEAPVSAGLAAAWQWPGLEGARARLLGHTAGAPGVIRLLETSSARGETPLSSPGWRSIELCVRDVSEIRTRITDTAFTIVGEPAPIPGSDDIRAMQVLGPAGEMLYLTEIGEQSIFELPTAHHTVERVFIVVLSAPDLDAARAFYINAFTGHDPAGDFTAPITCVNRVLDLPPTTEHTFCAVQLRDRSLIEIDQHPPTLTGTPPRTPAPTPPSGAVLMTFYADRLQIDGARSLGPDCSDPSAPYDGRTARTFIGPAGERFELLLRG